jgi:16S rRNA G966 N2-methylase RsmD
LAFFGALYPYLGGKRRLCPLVFREIDRVLPRRLWSGLTLLDGFSGGGAISLFAKAQGFRVVAVDIAERAHIVAQGLVANSRVRLTRDDVLRLLVPRTGEAGPVESTYAPSAFTVEQARFLDNALDAADRSADQAKRALYRLLAVRVAMLVHPLSQVRPGTIERVTSGGWESVSEKCVRHYVEGPRILRIDRLWPLAQRINVGVFEGQGTAIKGDIFEVLSTVQADVAYFDPPYAGTRSYEAEYKTLDAILGDAERPMSAFSRRAGAGMLDEVLRCAAHIPVWVLSFGNAVADLADLEAKMKALGRETRATAVQYAHKESVASEAKKALNKEFVVVGWDPDSALLHRAGSGDGVDRRSVFLVPDHVDLNLGGAEGAATLGLAGDSRQECHAPPAEFLGPEAGRPGGPVEAGVDKPIAVLSEGAVGHDDVGKARA